MSATRLQPNCAFKTGWLIIRHDQGKYNRNNSPVIFLENAPPPILASQGDSYPPSLVDKYFGFNHD